jgi:hypothetical protein
MEGKITAIDEAAPVTEDLIGRGRWLGTADSGDVLGDPDLDHVFAYWRRAAGDRAAPRRCDIDPPMDLPAFLPTMILFDVEDEAAGGFALRYRVLGTRLAEFAGRDLTGTTFAEAFGAQAVAGDLGVYEQVVRDRVCFFGERRSMVRERKEFERYRRIIMPVLANNGDRVGFVWSWLKFHGDRRLAP